jgi:hypothetical protein
MISRKFKSLLEHDSKHGLGLFWRIFSQNRWDCCSSCTKKWEFLLNLFGTDWVLNGFKNFDIVSYIVLSCLGIEHLQLFLFGWSHWNQVQWTFETCKDPGPRTAIGQGPWTGAVISCNQWDWDIFRPPLHSPYFIYNYIYISNYFWLLLILFLFYLYIVFQISVPVLIWIQVCHVFHTHAVLKSRPATSWPPTLRGPGKTHRSALLLQHRVTAKYEWMW